jgi:hypothetical protein
MKCIICNKERSASDEHIIPENIGGTIVIQNVCKTCNDIFGHDVDCLLIKNRNIYDAYKKIQEKSDLNLKFEFKDAFCHLENETRINASLRSDENKTLTTNSKKDLFFLDKEDTKFIQKYIESICKKENISDVIKNNSINNYLDWHNNPSSQNIYVDEYFGFTMEKREDDVKYNNIMSGDTPMRFIAKACVEFSYLFGIQNRIGNLDQLKNHALNGIKSADLKYHQEINENIEPIPFHVIIFENTQFIIGLFAQVYYSVDINWIGEVSQLRFANNLITKELVYCIENSGRLKSTDKVFVI